MDLPWYRDRHAAPGLDGLPVGIQKATLTTDIGNHWIVCLGRKTLPATTPMEPLILLNNPLLRDRPEEPGAGIEERASSILHAGIGLFGNNVSDFSLGREGGSSATASHTLMEKEKRL